MRTVTIELEVPLFLIWLIVIMECAVLLLSGIVVAFWDGNYMVERTLSHVVWRAIGAACIVGLLGYALYEDRKRA